MVINLCQTAGVVVKQTKVSTEVQGCSPLKRRGGQYFTDPEETRVEVFSAWAGRRGGQLHCGESIPVHHHHQRPGGCRLRFIAGDLKTVKTEMCYSRERYKFSSFLFLDVFLSAAAGLLRGAGPDGPVLVDPEDTLQDGSLCGCLHLSPRGGGHGGGWPAGWTGPGLQ